MPPLQALLALHGLWALAAVALAIGPMRSWSSQRLRLASYVLAAVGLSALAYFVGRELLAWYPSVPPSVRHYIVHRITFVIGTSTDIPVIQVLVTAIVFAVASRLKR